MPTIDDMSQFPHTKMLLKESMPLYPSAGILGRELINNCNLDDLNFTKGTVIYFSQWV
ncbi:MAG: cytochrome P450 [Cyanobacteria bacterium P01_G01_bin.67]